MFLKILLLFLSLCNFGLFKRKKNYEEFNYMLMGRTRCAGQLAERKTLKEHWTLKSANEACAQEECGSALSAMGLGRALRNLFEAKCGQNICNYHSVALFIKCSESVRLVKGPSLCSGTLQIYWKQSWTSVCGGGLDLQEVVCRELDCGAPSLLRELLSGEGQVSLRQTFHCEGNESALMKCSSSRSDTCSSGTAAHLTCSELVKLGGQPSSCAGTLELRHKGEWRPVNSLYGTRRVNTWDHNTTDAVCRQLHCGSAVSSRINNDSFPKPVWLVPSSCVTASLSLHDCIIDKGITHLDHGVEVVCSELLLKPNISLSADVVGALQTQPQGVSVLLGSNFSVRCSIVPQYPEGFFHLLFPSVDTAQSYVLPAVNHSALFLFSDAGPAHKGGYNCVYQLHVFSHNFSSQSHTLYISLWEKNYDYLMLIILPGWFITFFLFVLFFWTKRKFKNAQRKGRISKANLGVASYETVALEQVAADSTYQSLCPETMDHIYGELSPPQQQDSL